MSSGAGHPASSSIGEAIERAESKVLPLAAARFAVRLLPGNLSDRDVQDRRRIGTAIVCAAYLLLVLAVVLVSAGLDLGPRHAAWGWIAVYVLLVSFAFGAAVWAFEQIGSLAKPLDALLADQESRARIVSWINRRHGLGVQLGMGVLVAGFGVAAAYIAHHQHFTTTLCRQVLTSSGHAGQCIGPHLVRHSWMPDAGGSLYVITALTLICVTTVMTWLMRIPLIVRQLVQIRTQLTVVQHSPATTPAFRELSSFMGGLGIASAIGFVLFAIPLCWATILALSHAVTPCVHSQAIHCSRPWGLLWLSAIPLVGTVLVNIFVTVISQLWLTSAVAAQRNLVLDKLAGAHGLLVLADSQSLDDDQTRWRELYDAVAAAPVQPPDAQTVLRKTVLILSGAIPSLLLLAIRAQGVQQLFGLHLAGK